MQVVEDSYMDYTSPAIGVWQRELPVQIKRVSEADFYFYYKNKLIASINAIHVPDTAKTLGVQNFSSMKVGSSKTLKLDSHRLSYLLGGGRVLF
jgi:hypothetical protein